VHKRPIPMKGDGSSGGFIIRRREQD
jgi:hypothetical protein